MKALLSLAVLVLCASESANAQDPVKVDPKHYTVLFEDAQIRVLRITYGPGEKSVMHEHPEGGCLIILTDAVVRFNTADGKFEDAPPIKAGEVNCSPAGPGSEKHNPENRGTSAFSLVLVERKSAVKP